MEPEVQHKSKIWMVLLFGLLVLVVLILMTGQRPGTGSNLSEDMKEKIITTLKANNSNPDLSVEQRADVVSHLKSKQASNTVTAEERAQIINQLQNNSR